MHNTKYKNLYHNYYIETTTPNFINFFLTRMTQSSLHPGCSRFWVCLCPRPGIGEPNPQFQTSPVDFTKIGSHFQEGLAGQWRPSRRQWWKPTPQNPLRAPLPTSVSSAHHGSPPLRIPPYCPIRQKIRRRERLVHRSLRGCLLSSP
jgi:hypothetical protein